MEKYWRQGVWEGRREKYREREERRAAEGQRRESWQRGRRRRKRRGSVTVAKQETGNESSNDVTFR